MPDYAFRPLERADLPLVRHWILQPHVARWWGDVDEEMAAIATIFDDPHVEAFVMVLDGAPVGYFQAYDPNAEEGHPFAGEPAGTLGLDLSIGIRRWSAAAMARRSSGPSPRPPSPVACRASSPIRIPTIPPRSAPSRRRASRAARSATCPISAASSS